MAAAVVGTWRLKRWETRTADGTVRYPLDEDAISLSPDQPAELVWIREGTRPAEGWRSQHLVPEDGYVGAIAVPGRDVRLKCFSWMPDHSAVLAEKQIRSA